MNWDIVGYVGTAVVLGSFLINDIIRLRLVNTLGSLIWLIYGIGLSMMPQIVVNSSIILIHLYWFYKNKKLWKS